MTALDHAAPDMRLPVNRLKAARADVDRLRPMVRMLRAELTGIRARHPERAASAEKRLARARDELSKASADVERWGKIAGTIAIASRATLQTEAIVADAVAEGDSEREAEKLAKPVQACDRRRTETAHVESPYGKAYIDEIGVKQNKPDRVIRMLHCTETMRNRAQLTDRQKMAADRYRWSFENCADSIRCALDQSGRGGSGVITRSPSETQLQASHWLREATRVIGDHRSIVVQKICGEGRTIEEVANAVTGKASGKRRELMSRRLRSGLSVLANHWWPILHVIEGQRGKDAKPTEIVLGAFDPENYVGKVAHAEPGKITGIEVPEEPRKSRRKRSGPSHG